MRRRVVVAFALIAVCCACRESRGQGAGVDAGDGDGGGDAAADPGADSGHDADSSVSARHLCTYESCPDDPGPYGGSSANCPSVPPRDQAPCTLESVGRCYYCEPGQDLITADQAAEEYRCDDAVWVIDVVVNACH
jgi:hypothetical protein